MTDLNSMEECAAHGLTCAARMGLPPDSLTELAEAIIDGTHDPDALTAALDAWPSVADRNPHLAGVAWLLTGGSHTRTTTTPVAAMPDTTTEAEDAFALISSRLNSIQAMARRQVQSAMDVATRAAADRIGRVATQKVARLDLKDRCRRVEPRLAVAVMGRTVFAALELDEEERIRAALGEGVAVASQALTDRGSEVVNVIGQEFAVDFDPHPYDEFHAPALAYLEQRATEWTLDRLHEPDATAPDRFPSDIVITTLQVAGGSPAPVNSVPVRVGGLHPSFTTGPVFNRMLADVFDAYRGAPELAEAAQDAS